MPEVKGKICFILVITIQANTVASIIGYFQSTNVSRNTFLASDISV
jgi:hypothetical protein